jgi:hypothetical protein
MPNDGLQGERQHDLSEFYSILDRLEKQIGGARSLADCRGRMDWPGRGVYFFREPGELRTDTGVGPRIVRVGTHALRAGSSTKLWTRLSQHRVSIGAQKGPSIGVQKGPPGSVLCR